jgi:hypothetical protein
MNIAAITRTVSFLALAALFVTDYMFNIWAKEIPREVYLALVSVALGVDIQFIRNILVTSLTHTLGGGKKEEEEHDT